MANLYGLTKTDPVNAPMGIVSTPGNAIVLKEGFTVPSLKNGTIGGNLTVSGALNVSGITTLSNTLNNTANTTNLSILNVTGVTTFSSTVAINGSINSTILPQTNSTYNLGNTSYRWGTGWFSTINSTTVTATTVNATTITASNGVNITGGSLTVSAGLSVTGTISSSSTITGSSFSQNGAATSSLKTVSIENLTVAGSGSATFNSLITANNGLTISSGSLTISSGSFTVSSGALTASSISFGVSGGTTALNYYESNSYSGSLTGFASPQTITVTYTRIGNIVTISTSAAAATEGTSNVTTMTLTGMPTSIRPTNGSRGMPHIVKDNGILTTGKVVIGTDGTMTFYKDANNTAFTSSGTKGIAGLSISYLLTTV